MILTPAPKTRQLKRQAGSGASLLGRVSDGGPAYSPEFGRQQIQIEPLATKPIHAN
jgi:hypothetical protein